jgi:hypothetical protein
LIYIDCVASLYGRNSLGDIVQHATRDVFVPMTRGRRHSQSRGEGILSCSGTI